ncbi:MAG: sensor histidine kinase [Thermoanaerobaculia bacterium]|nr:sensor histidine kinase [Thermoanaerobaculia bacterium]
MPREVNAGRWLLRAAGLATLVLVGTPAVLMLVAGLELLGVTTRLSPVRFVFWLVAATVYAVAFWRAAGAVGNERLLRRARWLVGVQAVAALAMFRLVCTGLESTQLVLVAAQLGLFFPLPVGIGWVLAQTCLQAGIALLHWPTDLAVGMTVAFTLPYSFLALLIAHFAARQTRARNELARANAELRATQALLADSSRMAERARISDELHDLLGHHLTALTLNLEAASHRAGEPAKASIARAQSLARLLLSDVREAVSSLRGESRLDLAKALAPIVEELPRPRVHLGLAEDLVVTDPEQAHALVRCVQEIVTNAARHSGAENLWIDLGPAEEGTRVLARDDGRGASEVRAGQGLSGMRRRLEELGGRLRVASEPGGGFHVEAWVPLRSAP